MKKIISFNALRPVSDKAREVAIYSNNLLRDDERRERARKNTNSFAHVVKPKIDFADIQIPPANELMKYSKNYLQKLIEQGVLVNDNSACFYIYRQQLHGHSQSGIVCCYHLDEYRNRKIKKHEHTREEKEKENVVHLKASEIQGNPVFLAYKGADAIDVFVFEIQQRQPLYDFISDFDVRQTVWSVSDINELEKLSSLLNDHVTESYIADGHHRAASMKLFADEMKSSNQNHTGEEPYNYLFACLFPANQLKIFEYNRSVKDLNGNTEDELISKISEWFSVEKTDSRFQPKDIHEFGMYMHQQWYKLTAKKSAYTNNPVDVLDVSILQEKILSPLLGIDDPRTDKRIDFIEGTKGIKALEKKVNKGKASVAFALHPVSMDQLFAISDAGEVMPPKSTWFEPKLMSGLLIYKMS